MAVQVSTWSELLAAIPQQTDIVWVGAKHLDRVEIDINSTPSKSRNYKYMGGSSNVDFNGLEIDEMVTTGSYSTWSSGMLNNDNGLYYGGFKVDKMSNLTVNKLIISKPLDCAFYAASAYNVFINDTELIENDSNFALWQKWLELPKHDEFTAQGRIFPKPYEFFYAVDCIVSATSKDCPLHPYANFFINCEYNANVKELKDKSKYCTVQEYALMGNLTFYNCYVTGKIEVENKETELKLFIAGGSSTASDRINWIGGMCKNSIFNLDSNIFILANTAAFATHRTSQVNFWLTNGGEKNLRQTVSDPVYNVPLISDICQSTTGDMRNPDILRDRNFVFITDDGQRYDQYRTYSNSHLPSITDNESTPYEQYGMNGEDWSFRINPMVNDGIVFLPFWKYPRYDVPHGDGEVDDNVLCVYDMHTKQDEFFKNDGLGILHPTNCKVTEELNGGWRVTIEHPKDAEGKWKYIREFNILKVLGQLYIIRKVIIRKSSVYANAEHITYHLNDYWIYPPFSIAGYKGQTLLDSIMAQAVDEWEGKPTRYGFTITTDIDSVETFRDWYEIQEGHAPYEMILGGNGFIARLGGELYRDNFKMSINKRMQNAKENAFILHPDLNVVSIEKTVDIETFCTYFKAFDNFGGWWAVAWDPRGLERQYPHNIVRSQNFYYDEDYYSFDMLERDGMAYFKQNCCPLISYRMQVKDLKRHKDYKQFINNFRFKVGDIGLVWDSDSNRWMELEITKTVKDGVTGDCLEVTIGDTRSFTRPSGYSVSIDRNYDVVVDPESGDAEHQEQKKEDYGDLVPVTDFEFDEEGNVLRYIGTVKSVKMPQIEGKIITLNAFNYTGITELNISEGIEVIE